ncbi:capsule assembly Wzi family protein [Acidicapsa acidisoli]|uniref:capsule assembly Wzi family protein n=1 Tax=Acidicapsa acidisoli TaxID=1615681 RepID=UPI0021DFF328|nr:capsule assembly Wzi family protein [Acidicapsa acidisoli]
MSILGSRSRASIVRIVFLLVGTLLTLSAAPMFAESPGETGPNADVDANSPAAPVAPCQTAELGSPYIPMDSWVYPSLARLYSLGYVDLAFLGLRPWTRASVLHMLEETSAHLEDAPDSAANDEARSLYDAVMHEVNGDVSGPCFQHRGKATVESAYEVARGISGTPLHDSFHIGETITNDYGRPVENGFDSYSGVSGYATAGIFTLYARGEFQYAPSAAGYSQALFDQLSALDNIPVATNPEQPTIPLGPISSATNMRLMEGYLSAHTLGHEISFGKSDAWFGPAQGGAYAYSTNAENIYAFRIDRVEPLHIPGLSRITGPFRYEFMVGSLKGHTDWNDPWVHVEKISFKPTRDLEFGFERTVIWGGEGHVPITIHSFLKSFFSVQNVTAAVKTSRNDPGARFGAFDMSYRLPYLRNWLTFFTDSEAHDDVNPISAPRRADFRTGLYLSHVPAVPKLDLRVEAAMDDQSTSRSVRGEFTYYEGEQPQGYTNAGQIFGDWMGREAKGGQAWVTYHLSGNEWIQFNWRRQKAAKDFIAGGTTIDDYGAQVVKRIGHDLEVKGNFTYENYLAPIYLTNKQTVTNTTFQLTWYPQRKVSF